MDRATQKLYIILLTGCLTLPAIAQEFVQHTIGQWTQVYQNASFMVYKSGIKKPTIIKQNDKIQTEGSYLSSDDGQMTGKLFDNCWIRLGPKTKIVFTLSPSDKILYLKVFTGSVKILFNHHWTQDKVEKLILEAGEKQLEIESGKFVFIRRPFFNENNLYVEKGLVNLIHENRLQAQFIHQNEKLSFNDKTKLASDVIKMSEKEQKEISSSQYLKLIKQNSL